MLDWGLPACVPLAKHGKKTLALLEQTQEFILAEEGGGGGGGKQ
jgi:hypothetical protein